MTLVNGLRQLTAIPQREIGKSIVWHHSLLFFHTLGSQLKCTVRGKMSPLSQSIQGMTIFLGLLGNRSVYILFSDTDSPFHFTLMRPILDNKLKFHSIYDDLPPSVGTRLEKGVQWIWNRETEEIPQTIFQREKKKLRSSNNLTKFTQLVRARVGLNAGSVKAAELQKLSL